MNKKGNLNALPAIIMTIILLTVVLGVGLVVLQKFQTSQYLSTTATITNETLTTVTETGELLAKSTARDAVCNSVSQCINNTTPFSIIPAANYTMSNCIVRYSGATDNMGFNNSNWKCTYSYTWNDDTEVTNITRDSATAVGDIGDTWMTVIITASVAAIVLGLIIGLGATRRAK